MNLELFFKSHHLLVHFPFALIVVLVLIFSNRKIQKEKKQQILKYLSISLAFVNFYLCASGLGLALSSEVFRQVWYFHGLLGLLIYIFSSYLYFYREKNISQKVLKTGTVFVFLTVLSGVLSDVDWRYFRPNRHLLTDFNVDVYANDPIKKLKITSVLEKKCLKCHNSTLSVKDINFEKIADLQHLFKGDEHTNGLFKIVHNTTIASKRMPYRAGSLEAQELSEFEEFALSPFTYSISRDVASLVAHPSGIPQSFRRKPGAKQNWTFRRFTKPALPALKPGHLAFNEIDRFILADSPAEQNFQLLVPITRLKRLSLVSTGLNPKNSDTDFFKSHADQKSYNQFVTRYMNSLAYVENFAVYWMDLVAFADEQDRDAAKRKDAPQEFRNYLFKTLSNNPKYFEMVRSQIQPSRLANGKGYYFPSLFNNIPDQDNAEIYAETAQNVVYTFALGLEMKCARCHDHPSEPISNENYYQVMMPFKDEYKFAKDSIFLFRRTNSPVVPVKKFLDIYEGTDPKKQFDKVADLGDWLTNTKEGVGFFSARVFVDHVWRFVFGKGLVEQAGNFGATTPEPKHLALLNWLTHDFIEHDTSINYLIQKMLTSATFQSSSDLFQTRLLTSENIRDNILQATGGLSPESSPHLVGYAKDAYFDVPLPPLTNLRSVYFRRRHRDNDKKNVFESYLSSEKFMESTLERPKTLDLNTEMFFHDEVRVNFIFERINELLPEESNSQKLIIAAYRHLLSREPSELEIGQWNQFFIKQHDIKTARIEMLRLLVSSSEFLYIR